MSLAPAAVAVILAAAAVCVAAANDWRIKPFSKLFGPANPANDDWCADHGVARSACVACNPALARPVSAFGWCTAHGVHECTLCHPEVAELLSIPAVTVADRERVARALAFAERPANHPKCSLHTRRVQLASDDVVRRAGIEFAVVSLAPVTESIVTPAITEFDPTRVVRIASRVAGVVWRVDKHTGDRVSAGDLLAIVESAEVGKIKTELAQAIAHLDTAKKHLKVMRDSFGGVEGLKLTEAESAVATAELRLIAARQALDTLGLSPDAAEWTGLTPGDAAHRLRMLGVPEVEAGAASANLLAVTAPISGTITACEASRGDRADPAKPLFIIADGTTLWLTLHLGVEDAWRVTKGHTVRFSPNGGAQIDTTLGWISPAADEKTRTVAARAALINADGRLRARADGTAEIFLRNEPSAVVIPSSALHRDGNCCIVFVRDRNFDDANAPKLFHVRSVRPGAVVGDVTEIVAGVLPGEVVAAGGSAALRAELLKSSLGAG
jgi:cobalt-zinc-cadmium efflux system membrane fusion protein